MKNKTFSIIITLIIILFSFYYINTTKNIVKNIDPIMDKINKVQDKYEVKPIDGIIKDNTIIPGVRGKTIDKNLSYSKMKKYGAFNESLITIKDIYPNININNNYDKYIISGNKTIKKVSLIFIIDEIEKLDIITNYLNSDRIPATLLIDTDLLESNKNIFNNTSKLEIELSFKKITDLEISQYSNYLDSITGKKNKFCITKDKNDALLNNCMRYKMHTVIPNIYLSNNPTINIKKYLSNGSIILIDINDEIKKELDYIIFYIESKGYTITNLDRLLEE